MLKTLLPRHLRLSTVLTFEAPTARFPRLSSAFAADAPRRKLHAQSRRVDIPRHPPTKKSNVQPGDRPQTDKVGAKDAFKAHTQRFNASVLLISPTNQILLLCRVNTASAFSSAHVFPGGALSPEHDGALPAAIHPSGVVLTKDSETADANVDGDLSAYRMAAIRETFEESGILLATKKGKLFTDISDAEREEGRRAVHAGRILFPDLLRKWGCQADTQSLIPFTRWITPPSNKRRFSTQMYLYFLPLTSTSSPTSSSTTTPPSSGLEDEAEIVIPTPTHDGGIEHTAARFLPPNKWLALADQARIILYPPQYLLTWTLSAYLSPSVTSAASPLPTTAELDAERRRWMAWLHENRGFGAAIVSPVVEGRGQYGEEGSKVLRLDSSGAELGREGVRQGIDEWVVTTTFRKEGPRDVRVRATSEVFGTAGEGAKL